MCCSQKANAAPLTNFEVLDLLRSRGAATDTTRAMSLITPSEFKVTLLILFFETVTLFFCVWHEKAYTKFPVLQFVIQVYDYLVESAAYNQTRESINTFLEKSKDYQLTKAELINIINIRPTSAVEIASVLILQYIEHVLFCLYSCWSRGHGHKFRSFMELVRILLRSAAAQV